MILNNKITKRWMLLAELISGVFLYLWFFFDLSPWITIFPLLISSFVFIFKPVLLLPFYYKFSPFFVFSSFFLSQPASEKFRRKALRFAGMFFLLFSLLIVYIGKIRCGRDIGMLIFFFFGFCIIWATVLLFYFYKNYPKGIKIFLFSMIGISLLFCTAGIFIFIENPSPEFPEEARIPLGIANNKLVINATIGTIIGIVISQLIRKFLSKKYLVK